VEYSTRRKSVEHLVVISFDELAELAEIEDAPVRVNVIQNDDAVYLSWVSDVS